MSAQPDVRLTDYIGVELAPKDHEALAARWITPELAERAILRRVSNEEGRYCVTRTTGDYAGIVIPYVIPGHEEIREYRLRRDHPEMEAGAGGQLKPRQKYVWPPGRGNKLYFMPGTPAEWLSDTELPIIVSEGEFKAIALYRLAMHNAVTPRFLPVAFGGVWSWRGTIGKAPGPDGDRRDVKGPISDLAWINWQGRRVIVAFDADAVTNEQVRIARDTLARHLRKQGAEVGFLDWDIAEGKGIDDRLAKVGPEAVLRNISNVVFSAKRERKAEPKKRLLCHAVQALQESAEWRGVLAFNEFHQRPEAVRASPIGEAAPWSDQADRLTAIWLQEHGVEVTTEVTGQAVETIARGNSFHPIREYLDSLTWDGKRRIGQWLSLYVGVDHTPYSAAVGERWLIGAVARIFQPGCKVDTCLIIEGPQGRGKSRAAHTLAGDSFTDSLPDLSSKDAAVQLNGVWIVELAELDSLSRSEASTIKAFLSRSSDRFRPPYGKRASDFPRQTVFLGTSNQASYMKDESGGRRFWPVRCGEIRIDALARDRDQLWAEAVHQYRAGAPWWLETETLSGLAAQEQADRFEADPWQSGIAKWIEGREDVTIESVLKDHIEIPLNCWKQSDKIRVSRCLTALGWQRYQRRVGDRREWFYRQESESVTSVTSLVTSVTSLDLVDK